MIHSIPQGQYQLRKERRGTAAVEFGFCMPIIVTLLLGLWEVGRMVQVANVVGTAARKTARDASLGQNNLLALANNTLTYLQGSLGNFGQGHSTSMNTATSLPANTTGYTCWDNTASQELFTITFSDLTHTSVTDPTNMSQLDHYQLGVQIPYSTITLSPLAQITSTSRISITVDWACMCDAPFSVTPVLPAQ